MAKSIENPQSKTEKPKFTLEDLERERNWDGGFGSNNQGAESRKQRAHMDRLKEIEWSLIEQGILKEPEPTEEQKLNMELDELYPDAESRTIIEHNGKKYQIKYFPKRTSLSGKTVKQWGHTWALIEEKSSK